MIPERENIPEPDGYVFESPHVGLLMTIGEKRIKLDKDAQAAMGQEDYRFGTGLADGDIHGSPERAQAQARLVQLNEGQCWTGIIEAGIEMIKGSTDSSDLTNKILQTAAILVAWAEDVQARAT